MAKRKLTPEQRERNRIRTKKWYAEKGREWHKQYRKRNPEKVAAAQKKYAESGRSAEAHRARYAADPEKYRLKQKYWAEKQRAEGTEWVEKKRQRDRDWRAANRDEVNARRAQKYQEDLEYRERQKERASRWAKDNPGLHTAHTKARWAAKLQRTPPWADLDAISAVYAECAYLNELEFELKYHVDHIIPLQGETVSGLHVAENLQIIPAEENLRKHNKLLTA